MRSLERAVDDVVDAAMSEAVGPGADGPSDGSAGDAGPAGAAAERLDSGGPAGDPTMRPESGQAGGPPVGGVVGGAERRETEWLDGDPVERPGGAGARERGGGRSMGDPVQRPGGAGARDSDSRGLAAGQPDGGEDGVLRVRAMGDAAVLVELADLDAVLAHAAAIEAAGWPGVVDVVPGARTVVVIVRPGTDLAALRRAVRALDVGPVDAADGETVEIPVVYDGPDLDEVAELTGLDVDAVVAAHTGTPWRVGFGGFAPGFAYLVGGDERLNVPRQSEPRTKVPAGSVALAGEFSAIYPRESPGGWQLIGQMADDSVTLWDIDRDPPALLRPGMWVQFREVKS